MAGDTDSNGLEAWLKRNPPVFACIIAARVALRVVPLFVEALREEEKERRAAIVLPGLRAVAAASFAAAWPARAAEIRMAASTASSQASGAIGEASDSAQQNLFDYKEISENFPHSFIATLEANVRALDVAEHAVKAAVSAAQTVVDTVDAANGVAAPDAATEAAISTCKAASDAVDGSHGHAQFYSELLTDGEADAGKETEIMPHITEFWKAVDLDTEMLTTTKKEGARAGPAEELLKRKLWLNEIPIRLGRSWAQFKEELPEDEGWQVWVDWYEDRLVGRSACETLEFQRVTIADEDWKRGPAHVNAIIQRQVNVRSDPLLSALSRGFAEMDAVKQATSIDLTEYNDRIRKALPNDPHQAIGATKDMLEATMKTILYRRGIEIPDHIDFRKLVTRCLTALELRGTSEPTTEGERQLRKIASSAQRVIVAANQLRDRVGTGHGRVVGNEPVVTPAEASLVASIGMALAAWMLHHNGDTRVTLARTANDN